MRSDANGPRSKSIACILRWQPTRDNIVVSLILDAQAKPWIGLMDDKHDLRMFSNPLGSKLLIEHSSHHTIVSLIYLQL